MRRSPFLLALLGALVSSACGPTVFKGPTGPETGAQGPKGPTAAVVNAVEMPFAVHTRSRLRFESLLKKGIARIELMVAH